jgi:YggT family protein
MGAPVAFTLVLADTRTAIANFVQVFVAVYTLLIFAYILTSWVRLPYSLSPVQRFLYDVCEPYIRLFRRFIPPFGPLDLSPMVAVAVLWLIDRLLVAFL